MSSSINSSTASEVESHRSDNCCDEHDVAVDEKGCAYEQYVVETVCQGNAATVRYLVQPPNGQTMPRNFLFPVQTHESGAARSSVMVHSQAACAPLPVAMDGNASLYRRCPPYLPFAQSCKSSNAPPPPLPPQQFVKQEFCATSKPQEFVSIRYFAPVQQLMAGGVGNIPRDILFQQQQQQQQLQRFSNCSSVQSLSMQNTFSQQRQVKSNSSNFSLNRPVSSVWNVAGGDSNTQPKYYRALPASGRHPSSYYDPDMLGSTSEDKTFLNKLGIASNDRDIKRHSKVFLIACIAAFVLVSLIVGTVLAMTLRTNSKVAIVRISSLNGSNDSTTAPLLSGFSSSSPSNALTTDGTTTTTTTFQMIAAPHLSTDIRLMKSGNLSTPTLKPAVAESAGNKITNSAQELLATTTASRTTQLLREGTSKENHITGMVITSTETSSTSISVVSSQRAISSTSASLIEKTASIETIPPLSSTSSPKAITPISETTLIEKASSIEAITSTSTKLISEAFQTKESSKDLKDDTTPLVSATEAKTDAATSTSATTVGTFTLSSTINVPTNSNETTKTI